MSRLSRSAVAGLSVLLALTLTVTGCSGGGGGTSVPDTDADVLTLAASSAPVSLDPGETANGGAQTWYQILAYEPLIDTNAEGELVPGLATEWGYVDGSGGTKFELTLRADAKFADGTPVTGEAVADSISWFAENATGPSSGSFKGWVIEATGETSVLITTPTPTPIVADLLTPYNLGGNIISPAGLADPGSLANATFGAGPYVYDATQSTVGDHYTYVPNENYYDPDRISFDKVVIRVIASPTSALSALRSGQVDVIVGDTSTVDTAKDAGFTVINKPSGFVGFFIYDWGGELQPALADVSVRQAMNYAIDRESIATAIFGDYGSATMQPNTPGWDAFDPGLQDAYPYDPEKAKDLLAKAGYADGFSFDLVYTSFEPNTTKLIQAVAEQLAAVGITVNLTGAASFGDLVTGINSGSYSATSLGWGGQTQYANTNQLWLTTSPLNPRKTPVDGLDDAFAAYSASDETNREETARAVQQIIVEQALSVPVVSMDSLWVHSPKLKGIAADERGVLNNPADWEK